MHCGIWDMLINLKFTIKVEPATFSSRSASKSVRKTKYIVKDCKSRSIKKWGYRYLSWRFCNTVSHKQLTKLVRLQRNFVVKGFLLHVAPRDPIWVPNITITQLALPLSDVVGDRHISHSVEKNLHSFPLERHKIDIFAGANLHQCGFYGFKVYNVTNSQNEFIIQA